MPRISLYTTFLLLSMGCAESRSSSCDEAPQAVMNAPVPAPSAIKKEESQEAIKHKSRSVRELEFSADGKRLATSGNEGTHVWDATTGAHVIELSDGLLFTDVEVSPDGTKLATGGCGVPATLWDATTGDILDPLSESDLNGEHSTIELSTTDVDFSPNGEWIAVADSKGFSVLFEAKTGEELVTLFQGEEGVEGVSFSKDNKRLLTKSAGKVMIWNPRTHTEIRSLSMGDARIFLANFSDTGAHIETLTEESGAVVFSLWSANGALQKSIKLPLGAATWARLSENQRWLVAANHPRGNGFVYDIRSGKPVGAFELTAATNYQFSPDNKFLFVGYRGGSIQKLSLEDRGIVKTWQAHPRSFLSLVISPNGKHFATAGDDGAKLWSIETGELLFHFKLEDKCDAVDESEMVTAQR